jgi:hypothetical protein
VLQLAQRTQTGHHLLRGQRLQLRLQRLQHSVDALTGQQRHPGLTIWLTRQAAACCSAGVCLLLLLLSLLLLLLLLLLLEGW